MSLPNIANKINELCGKIQKLNRRINLLENPPLCDDPKSQVWKTVNKDLTNRAYNPDHGVTNENIDDLEEKFRAAIGILPGATADAWVGITFDKCNIYGATHNQQDSDGSTTIDPNGWLLSVSRKDGTINWRREIKSYSNLNGDNTRAAPAIWEDYLFFGSNTLAPQSWTPPVGDPNLSTYTGRVYSLFSGAEALPAAKKIRMYAVNKRTGELIWETPLGKIASNIRGEDNFLTITQSPIVFESDYDNSGNKIPIVAIGTSSTQSFTPFLNSYSPTTIFSPSPITAASIGADNRYRMTDVGKLYLINGLNGVVLKEIRSGPEQYKTGDMLSADSIRPGQTEMKIFHYIESGEAAQWQTSGSIPASYHYGAGRTTTITWALRADGTNTMPSVLVGLTMVKDNTNTTVALAAGIIPANLNGVVITLPVTITANDITANGMTITLASVTFATTDFGFDGSSGAFPRLNKWLSEGDVLTDQDAYEASYHGPSIWGSSPAVNFDSNGNPVELYFATGQNHHIPCDEAEAITSVGNNTIQERNEIKDAQLTFEADRTQANLDAIRTLENGSLTNIELRKSVALSVRGERNYNNAVVAVDLRPNNFGEILWVFKSNAYDTWHLGYSLVALRSLSPVADVPINVTPPFNNATFYTDIQEYYGFVRSPDGDFGEGPYLFPGASSGMDVIGLTNKAGNYFALELSDVNVQSSTPTLIGQSRGGNPGLLGGSNFGSCGDNNTLYSAQTQAPAYDIFNLDYQTGNKGDYTNLAQQFPPWGLNWYPLNENDPATIVPFIQGQSYLSAFDVTTGVVKYEVTVSPQASLPTAPITTISNPSCSKDFIYVLDGQGFLQIFKRKTGEHVKMIDLGSGGNGQAVLGNNDIYILNGRGAYNSSFQSPPNNYRGTPFLYGLTVSK